MTQAQLLADTFKKARTLTLFYLSKLKGIDPMSPFELGKITTNSIYWHVAHLMWAEDNLIMILTGADSVAPDWAQHYQLGCDGSLHAEHGTFKELLSEFKTMHPKCMAHLSSLSDEELSEDNSVLLQFGDGDISKRLAIQHAIRHESTHTGHLGWIAKINEVATI